MTIGEIKKYLDRNCMIGIASNEKTIATYKCCDEIPTKCDSFIIIKIGLYDNKITLYVKDK